jgi:hypothetical protein
MLSVSSSPKSKPHGRIAFLIQVDDGLPSLTRLLKDFLASSLYIVCTTFCISLFAGSSLIRLAFIYYTITGGAREDVNGGKGREDEREQC